ncbi:glycosyl transferase [Pyrococcus furiosus DSM 3638]|uniref:Glycosyl transferase n=3 Tax=Pyrococcus furiosus TaxID=2261 RepID=Q8U2R3_PYRFU|nr:glycosyltransferase [Pyrococcus furiosus]AAL80893.1 glycosyl transferase [Pyrococcus furiosus DSM 3638]AFN03553.1 glycosyl transferase family protein [Pyrococcus furiosus COM1]QEK78448.1 glycosyl transferase [Pyrococcus furiosus DSM 3638]
MSRPTVSVIIPTHNRAKLLKRAIISVLNQTFEDFEIIVVDDASSDNTPNIIESIKDSRIRYIRLEKNSGAPTARNIGIKKARGKFIALLDDDDEWLPRKLEVQVKKFNELEKKFGVVYGGFYYVSQQNERIIGKRLPRFRGNVYGELLKENFIGSPTVLIRRECFKKAGLFDPKLPSSQDWDMWVRIARYYYFDYIVAKYYVHGHQISFNINEKYIPGREIFISKHKDIANNPKILSMHLTQMGLLSILGGNIEKGVKYLAQSITISPLNIDSYKKVIELTLDSRFLEYVKNILHANY